MSFPSLEHIQCESNDKFDYKQCPAGGKIDRVIGIFRQLSGSKLCKLGETYGALHDYVWVNAGCRAVIMVVLGGRSLSLCGICFNTKKIYFYYIIYIIMYKYTILLGPPGCSRGLHSEVRDCCRQENPCGEGKGDCDKSYECKENLVCGKNNCDSSKFPSRDTDCCEEGTPQGR